MVEPIRVQDPATHKHDFAIVDKKPCRYFRSTVCESSEDAEKLGWSGIRLLLDFYCPKDLSGCLELYERGFDYLLEEGAQHVSMIPQEYIESTHLDPNQPGEGLERHRAKTTRCLEDKAKNTRSEDLCWSIASIIASIDGWHRLAYPKGRPLPREFSIINADGWFPAKVSVLPAPDLFGLRTIWCSAVTSLGGSFGFWQHEEGTAELYWDIKMNLFLPIDDPRSPESITLGGIPLGHWQALNQQLLQPFEERIKEVGWVPK